MSLKLEGHIDLPAHRKPGGFDHAAIHAATGTCFVAHTANDALDVIDIRKGTYVGSIEGLPAVAGVLVSDEVDLVFTSNRGDDTAGIFPPRKPSGRFCVRVGVRPNGLAFDAKRGVLLVATLGEADPEPGKVMNTLRPPVVSIVDVAARKTIASLQMQGRTRWAVFDPVSRRFLVAIGTPSQVAVVSREKVSRAFSVPCPGAHGLDLDPAGRRLYCACDGGELVALSADDGAVLKRTRISGVPDVVWFHPGLKRVYVAIADPGVIDVFDAESLEKIESVPTERGAKTTALDAPTNRLFAFLPATHRAAVYGDSW